MTKNKIKIKQLTLIWGMTLGLVLAATGVVHAGAVPNAARAGDVRQNSEKAQRVIEQAEQNARSAEELAAELAGKAEDAATDDAGVTTNANGVSVQTLPRAKSLSAEQLAAEAAADKADKTQAAAAAQKQPAAAAAPTDDAEKIAAEAAGKAGDAAAESTAPATAAAAKAAPPAPAGDAVMKVDDNAVAVQKNEQAAPEPAPESVVAPASAPVATVKPAWANLDDAVHTPASGSAPSAAPAVAADAPAPAAASSVAETTTAPASGSAETAAAEAAATADAATAEPASADAVAAADDAADDATPPATAPVVNNEPAKPEGLVERVIDRPLDIDGGPKIAVSRIELVDVVDRPEVKISVAEVQALVDAKVAEFPQGMTVGRLQEMATVITQYYRAKGMILAQAFLPVQDVQGGVVKLQVLEGVLDRLLVEGNKGYHESTITAPFQDLTGKPVVKSQVESSLLHLSDYPGLSMTGVFQPGQKVGSSDMVIKVSEEDRFVANIRHDNHGLRETGVRRTRIGVDLNGIFGADHLAAVVQGTHIPENLFFYGFEYDRPFFGAENRLRAGWNRNFLEVGGSQELKEQDISTRTINGHLGVEHSFIRSRERNLEVGVDLARKQSITHIKARDVSRDELAVLTANLSYDSVDTRLSGLNSAFIEYSKGLSDFLGSMPDDSDEIEAGSADNRPSRRGASGKFATADFQKLFISASRLQSMGILGKLFKKPEWFKGQALLLRTEGQWSFDLLTPLEQYSIGGPSNVRAYEPTEALFDKALFFSAEYIINAPGFADKEAFAGKTWGELLQLSLFYDVAFGRLNDPLRSDLAFENFNGAGFAVSYNNPGGFATKITVAHPINSPSPNNDREPQVWMEASYDW